MEEPTTKDRGLAPRVIAYMQARPGQVISIEDLAAVTGVNGGAARRQSVQNVMNMYLKRSPEDIQVVSSGHAWIWRGAPASEIAGSLVVIRVLADETLVCEGPGSRLYHAKEIKL